MAMRWGGTNFNLKFKFIKFENLHIYPILRDDEKYNLKFISNEVLITTWDLDIYISLYFYMNLI
jgi:hypothetical protein